jgi:hypothetical protein
MTRIALAPKAWAVGHRSSDELSTFCLFNCTGFLLRLETRIVYEGASTRLPMNEGAEVVVMLPSNRFALCGDHGLCGSSLA